RRRPTQQTASYICYELLNLPLIEPTSAKGLSDLKVAEYRIANEQAVVIALDAAITAAEWGQMLTSNLVLVDSVGRSFSDWYRWAIEQGPARISWEMSTMTLRGAWRDLLRNGINVAAVLEIAQRGGSRDRLHRVYTTKRVPTRGYTIELNDETALLRNEFLRAVNSDAAYHRSA